MCGAAVSRPVEQSARLVKPHMAGIDRSARRLGEKKQAGGGWSDTAGDVAFGQSGGVPAVADGVKEIGRLDGR